MSAAGRKVLTNTRTMHVCMPCMYIIRIYVYEYVYMSVCSSIIPTHKQTNVN